MGIVTCTSPKTRNGFWISSSLEEWQKTVADQFVTSLICQNCPFISSVVNC